MTESSASTASEPQEGEQEPKTFDAEYVKALRAEAAKSRVEAKAGAEAIKRLAQLEESQKTEAQRLTERAEAAEKAAQESAVRALRLEVASEKGLTAAQAKRLVGASREELVADAEEILADFPVKPGRPRGEVDQGPRGGAPSQSPAQEFASFLQGQMRQ